jgi:hypothetical protein
MKRLDYVRQKLSLSLHRTGILKSSEVIVCSVLHTFVLLERHHAALAGTGVSKYRFHDDS